MNATSTSSRSREEAHRPAARLTRGRARVSVPWIESLEDRTLLASPFATAASQLKTDLQSVQSGITNALHLASAIPILGNKLDLAAPLETLFGDFANPLEALLNPSPPPQAPLTATDIQNGLDAALGPWLGPKGIIAFNTPSGGGFSTTIDLRVALTPETFNTADFNVGLGSFLTLSLNSQASFQVGLDYLLSFSVDGSGNVTLDDSPSLQTTLSDAALPNTPLAIDFSLTLDHFKASGTIDNLMAVTAADVGDTGVQATDPNPTIFAGAIGVAVGSNESAALNLQATANVNWRLPSSSATTHRSTPSSGPISTWSGNLTRAPFQPTPKPMPRRVPSARSRHSRSPTSRWMPVISCPESSPRSSPTSRR